MPAVQINPAILEFIMSDVIWFLSEPYRDSVFIAASFDEHWVKVNFGYSANYLPGHVTDDYRQFETASTSHEFSGDSLALYNMWRRLKVYGGELSVHIQDNGDSNTSSKIDITIKLRR